MPLKNVYAKNGIDENPIKNLVMGIQLEQCRVSVCALCTPNAMHITIGHTIQQNKRRRKNIGATTKSTKQLEKETGPSSRRI